MQFDSEKPLAARLWSFRSWVRSLLPLGHTDGIPKCRVHQFFTPLWASFGDADETATDTNATKTSQNRNNFRLKPVIRPESSGFWADHFRLLWVMRISWSGK